MEARSIEDDGDGICFHVYAYNCQPGVEIDYRTGESGLADEVPITSAAQTTTQYILNIKSKKFHRDNCKQGSDIQEDNRMVCDEARDVIIAQGYQPAGCCNP
jgi:DNA-entry nuclease